MSSHAKPRSRMSAVAAAAFAKPRRRLVTLAAAVVVAPGLALLASSIPANASIPAHPRWESSAAFGTWTTGKFDLYNNEWNTAAAGPQTIWGDSYKHWGVQSTQADSTSVKTYPSVQENYSNTTLGSLHGLWSNFAEKMPSRSNFDAEAAYDIWLNNYKIEVMVWVDNHGQRPAGNVIANTTIAGKRFAVWQSGSSMYTFELSGKQETRGTIHLLKTMSWLVRHRYLSSSDSLTQVNFGWEICSTDGTPMDFTVTHYGLTTKR
jgi:hypothetical protein